MPKRNYSVKDPSDMYCVFCGNRNLPIWRRKGGERAAGHLKKLYCIYCKMETNNAECKPFSHYTHEDFLLEFNNGNFDEYGNRKIEYSQFKQKMNKRKKNEDE